MTIAGSIKPPFDNLRGLKIQSWDSTEVRLALDIAPDSLNAAGALHGGVLATLVDMAGAMAGCYASEPQDRPRVVTLALSVNFIAPAHGGVVVAHGRKRGGGASVYMSTVEVTGAQGQLIATGQGTFKIVADRQELPSTIDAALE